MFAFIKIRAARFNIFSSRFAANFLDFWLFCWIVRFWQQVYLDHQDPDPTRSRPDLPRLGPDPEYRTIVTSFKFGRSGSQARKGHKRTIVTSLIQQVERSPGYRSLRLGKKRTIIRFFLPRRSCLLDPEQKKLQQVLESLCKLLVDLFVI